MKIFDYIKNLFKKPPSEAVSSAPKAPERKKATRGRIYGAKAPTRLEELANPMGIPVKAKAVLRMKVIRKNGQVEHYKVPAGIKTRGN